MGTCSHACDRLSNGTTPCACTGVPLCGADGKPVAALCIMDSKPASEGLLPAEARRAMLGNFADMATRELEREQALQAQAAAEAAMGAERARLLRMMDVVSHAACLPPAPELAGGMGWQLSHLPPGRTDLYCFAALLGVPRLACA